MFVILFATNSTIVMAYSFIHTTVDLFTLDSCILVSSIDSREVGSHLEKKIVILSAVSWLGEKLWRSPPSTMNLSEPDLGLV